MKGKRLDQLQFLRFIGFCFIFLFHALGTNLEPYFYSANSAYAMVSFFFILSGFGSGYSSADRYEKPTVKAMLLHQWKKIKKEPFKAYGYIVKKQIDRVKRKTVSIYRRLRNDT